MATGLIVRLQEEPNVDSPPAGDYIRVEYHPNSKKAPITLSPEEFKSSSRGNTDKPVAPLDQHPWRPFRTREDFELAELVHAAALNKDQVDTLVKLIKRCERNPGSLTFEGVQDVERSWEDTSKLLTPVRTFQCAISLHS
jgi:hypothetical protein